MRVAYVDMIGGAAGDMLMGAWVDAGLDVGALEAALRTIVHDGWKLVTTRVERRGVAATYLDLEIPGEDHHAHDAHGHHRHGRHQGWRLHDVLAIIERSGLTPRQMERASSVYRRLAEAEARVANERIDDVLFHRVGQIDAILDVAGTCIALDLFGIEELRCSPFPVGRISHGASAELRRGFPTRDVDVDAELVSATGTAILTTLATPADAPQLHDERSGYGAGRNDFPFPNVVRIRIGDEA